MGIIVNHSISTVEPFVKQAALHWAVGRVGSGLLQDRMALGEDGDDGDDGDDSDDVVTRERMSAGSEGLLA